MSWGEGPAPRIHRAEVDALLARYGWRARGWRVLARLGGTVLRLRAEAASAQVPNQTVTQTVTQTAPQAIDLVLRLHPAGQGDSPSLRAEIAWLQALSARGLAVPRPVLDTTGQWLQAWPGGGHAVLYAWQAGRGPGRSLSASHVRQVGVLLAHLHVQADVMQADLMEAETQQAAAQPACHREAFGARLQSWLDDTVGARRAASPCWSARAQARAGQLAAQRLAQMASWSKAGGAHGLVHGDLHPWNTLRVSPVGPGQPTRAAIIDFGDCGQHWRALDFSSLLLHTRHDLLGVHAKPPPHAALRDALLDGYVSVRPLWPGVEEQIDALMLVRWLALAERILDVWPRPDARDFGPYLLQRVAQWMEQIE